MTASYLGIFAAGVVTVLSPCVLPLAPILIGGLVAGDRPSPWARLRATSSFGFGFTVVFVLLGLGVSLLVNVVRPLRPVLLAGAATMIVLYGVKMMGLLQTSRRFAWLERSIGARTAGRSRIGNPRPLLFGVIFALTWTPCAGPVLGGVLAYVAAEQERAVTGALMLLTYAAGVATPLVLIAATSDYVRPVLRRLGAHLGTLERAIGAGLVVLGVFLALRIPFSPDRLAGVEQHWNPHETATTAAPGAQLLFFHSEHCPTCRAMDAALLGLERDCKSDRWMLTRIDVDRVENATVSERFNVRAVPTMSLLDAQGHEVLHLVGYRSPEQLRGALESEIRVACMESDARPPADDDAVGRACEVGKPC